MRLTVSNSDVNLVAEVDGPAEGPSVLFLHAGGENRTVWRPIADAVCKQGWRTIAFDFRGHGESSRAPHYAFDDFVLDVELVQRALAGQPLVIVGSSIGGALGIVLAGEGRVPVAGLVLLDTPTRPKAAAARNERDRIAAAQARGAQALAALDPAFVRGSFLEEAVADLARWSRAAQQLRVPTLLVRGERSAAVGAEELTETKADVPHIDVVSVPAGHLVARDCPHDVIDHLVAFLPQCRQPAARG